MKHVFLSIALGIIIFGIYLAIYLGAFSSVEISREKRGPLHLVYKVHRGAYHKIVPTIEEVESWAKDQGYGCKRSFGQYLNRPVDVEEERLTSRGGCIIDAPLDDLPPDFENLRIPEQEFIVARFSGSPGIGPMKVYPKVYDWANERRIKLAAPVIEIYEILPEGEMHTQYLFSTESAAVIEESGPRP